MSNRSIYGTDGRAGLALVVVLSFLSASCTSPGGAKPDENDPFAQGRDREPTPQTLYAMARVLSAQGKNGSAQFVLTRLLEEYPDYRPAYSDLAEISARLGKMDDAVATLESALAKWPDDPVLLNNLGMCHIGREDYAKALEYFSRASDLSPQSNAFRANKAVALGLMGRYDESLEIYRQFLPEAESHYNLAVLCEARGDKERAQQAYSRAAELGFKPEKKK